MNSHIASFIDSSWKEELKSVVDFNVCFLESFALEDMKVDKACWALNS